MRKVVISLICIVTLLFGGVVYADDSISIDQKISIDVYNGWDTREFTYTLVPEENPTGQAVKGVEGGVTLQTTTLTFNSTDGNEQSKPVSLSINSSAFTSAGIYQYRLSNQYEYCILEVTMVNNGGAILCDSYCFYDQTGVKTDKLWYGEALIPPPIALNEISIKFVDNEGNEIADTIVFGETKGLVAEAPVVETPAEEPVGEPLAVEPKNEPVVKGLQRLSANFEPDIINAEVQAVSVDEAYGMYEVTLQGLLDKGYTVVTDEVAEHGKTGIWAKNDSDTVYTVTLTNATTPQATFRVKVAKMSSGVIKYTLKGAEFTLFDADGNIVNDVSGNPCVGLTDENGNLEFRIYNDGKTYYIQETKAPSGYEINEEKFYITPDTNGATNEADNTIFVPITVFDNPMFIFPPTPKTGDNFPMVILVGLAVIGVAGLTTTIIITSKKRKEREEK